MRLQIGEAPEGGTVAGQRSHARSRADTNEIGRKRPIFFSSDRAAARCAHASWCIDSAVAF